LKPSFGLPPQALPAPHYEKPEYNGAGPEGLCLGRIFLKDTSDAFEEKREPQLFGFSDPKSEWFIKDEPQRAEAVERIRVSSVASVVKPEIGAAGGEPGGVGRSAELWQA